MTSHCCWGPNSLIRLTRPCGLVLRSRWSGPQVSVVWSTRPQGLTYFLSLSSFHSLPQICTPATLAFFHFLESPAPSSLGAFAHAFKGTLSVSLSLLALLIAPDPSVLSLRTLISVKPSQAPARNFFVLWSCGLRLASPYSVTLICSSPSIWVIF